MKQAVAANEQLNKFQDDENELLRKIEQNSDYNEEDISLIKKSYKFAVELYGIEVHKSGVPLMEHTISIVQKLLDIKSDANIVAAGFLHDSLKHTTIQIEELINVFGEDIAHLVKSVQLFNVHESSKINYLEKNIENLIVEMTKDLRTAVIRLVHRLDDLENIKWRKPNDKKDLLRETREIYIPLADRLGMRSICSKLEDLSFKHTHSAIYAILEKKLEETKKEDEAYLELIITAIKKLLWEKKIHASVTGRIKNIYGLYRKMVQLKIPPEKLLDKIAVRMIVDDVPTCYQVLGILHSHFVHVPRTFDDYISLPKPNNYQSIHTCIYPIHNFIEKPIEIQIRTPQMHQVAEYGIAAHWRYKEDLTVPTDPVEQLRWVKNLVELKKDHKTPKSFYSALKKSISQEFITIFDEKGRVIYFPKGSTPMDFARIEGLKINQSLDKVKLNGKPVKFTQKMKDGDMIEICFYNGNRQCLD